MIQNLEGAWLFLVKITETAPLGVWTFLIATIIPACVGPYLRRGLPAGWHPGNRDFFVETVALLAGIGLAYLPWPTLQGLLVGILGGFMSPYLTRGWQTVARLIVAFAQRRLGVVPPADQYVDQTGRVVRIRAGKARPDPQPFDSDPPP